MVEMASYMATAYIAGLTFAFFARLTKGRG